MKTSHQPPRAITESRSDLLDLSLIVLPSLAILLFVVLVLIRLIGGY